MPNIGPLELVILLGLIVVPGYLVARHAQSKGYSFALFFVFWLVLWPAALIVALVLPDKRRQAAP
ncbi:MAG TPA: hypothetical protein VF715_07955 [Thermoleophilaceae bacterium]|jgi:hypothetical protein